MVSAGAATKPRLGDATEWNVQPIYPEQEANQWTAWHRNVLIPKKANKTADDLEALRGKPLVLVPGGVQHGISAPVALRRGRAPQDPGR